MSKWVPFTAHIKIFPARPGKRVEYIRELQRYAFYIYDALNSHADLNLASPGGGQQRYGGDIFSAYNGGGAVTPQFGNQPPQVTITGFYNSSTDNNQPHPDHTIISAGSTLTRAGGENLAIANPTTAIASEVSTLKTLLETEIAAGLPDGMEFTILRLTYSGIIWGDRGLTFP